MAKDVRNQKSKDIEPVKSPLALPTGTPDWLAAYNEVDESKTAMAEHRVLARIKVVQALSNPEIKDKFGDGSVIATPSNVLLCEKRGEIFFVPVLFFPEYISWADRNDSNSPAILARSFEKTSEVGIKARSSETREEEYGDGFIKKNCEHLNFAGFLYGEHEFSGTPIVLSFSRAEHRVGSQMVTTAFMVKAPLWSQVFRVAPVFRDKGPQKKWYGLEVSPAGFITAEEAEFFRTAHEELKTEFEARKLAVNHDDARDETAPGEDAEM